jgi:hypothetical protein
MRRQVDAHFGPGLFAAYERTIRDTAPGVVPPSRSPARLTEAGGHGAGSNHKGQA